MLDDLRVWAYNKEVIVDSCEAIINSWFASKIIVKEGSCNDFIGDYLLKDYFNLKTLVMEKNTMQNLNTLTIKDNMMLESIIIEDGSDFKSALENVNIIVITSIIDFLIRFKILQN